jgi:hypothetical protein
MHWKFCLSFIWFPSKLNSKAYDIISELESNDFIISKSMGNYEELRSNNITKTQTRRVGV